VLNKHQTISLGLNPEWKTNDGLEHI